MKTKIIILACVASTAFAADMVITVPTADVPRVQEAFGSILNLGRPANLAEVQQATTNWVHQSTTDYERRKNTYTFSPPPMQMAPSPSPTAGGLKAAPEKAAAPTATPKKKK